MAHSNDTHTAAVPLVRNFDFTGRMKVTLLVGIVIGVLSMLLTFIGDDHSHSRFWSNLLHNSTFFTGIGLMAGFFMCASITAWAGWYTNFKRVWESMSLFLGVGLIFMLVIALAVWMGWNDLYHWNDANSVATDPILKGKAGFLNRGWYLFGTIIFGGLWYFVLSKIRSLSLGEEADGGYGEFRWHDRIRVYAVAYLPLAGFGSAAMIWLWIMSVDAHWYSTLFAWYTGASWFVSMISATILLIIFFKGRGYYSNVSHEHVHDLGKLLFAFSIFWTYLWFSQFMLIWYANVGEETGYFKHRMDNYPILFYGNLVVNFVLPFFVLMRNSTKRKFGIVGFISVIVFIGHWLDFFLMIKPGVLHTTHELNGHGGHGAEHGGHGHEAVGHAAEHGHEAVAHAGEHVSHFTSGFTLPGFLEIGTFIGFLSLFIFFILWSMSRATMQSENDPYYYESVQHHT